MYQANQPYPIILNSLNLVACIRGTFPEVKLANTTKKLILNQLLLDQSNVTSIKSIGIDRSPSNLPNTLLADFSNLKEALVKAKSEGVSIIFISSLQDIKYEGRKYRTELGSFNENMNKTVNELIELSKAYELTLVVGVDITKLENIPPYALNKKANLWVVEDIDKRTYMNHNRNKQASYTVDFDPHTGISFELNQQKEIVFNNDKEIVAMREELNILSNELKILLIKEVPLESLTQVSKKVAQVSESLIHKIRQQVKLKDLIKEGLISLEDILMLSHKNNHYRLEMSLEEDEVLLKDSSGGVYKTPSGAASTIMGRSANGWNEIQVISKEGKSKGDLLGMREVIVSKHTTYKFSKIEGRSPKAKDELTIPEKVLKIFHAEKNKGKTFDYIEMYQLMNKDYPGTFKGQTPEFTVSATLSTLVKDGKINVAKPSGGKSKYYV